MERPQKNHVYADFYQRYIDYVPENSLKEVIAAHENNILSFYKNLPAEKADHKYAEGKWTIKQLLQHIIDTERVFAYRALTFARKDKAHLPGFDENEWAENAPVTCKSFEDLKKEFLALHSATTLMLNAFTDDQLESTGISNHHYCNVNAQSYVIYGHLLHHKKILEERYL